MYTGYNADYPSDTFAAAAWSPGTSQYFMLVSSVTSSPWLEGYVFSIDADNNLPGCYKLSNDYGSTWTDCYSFTIPASHKSPLGSWEMSMESQNDPTDINKVFEKKMAEVQEAQAQRTESSSPVDGDLVSKINELKAMIENHR